MPPATDAQSWTNVLTEAAYSLMTSAVVVLVSWSTSSDRGYPHMPVPFPHHWETMILMVGFWALAVSRAQRKRWPSGPVSLVAYSPKLPSGWMPRGPMKRTSALVKSMAGQNGGMML
jgi:hypothetical protein